MYVQDPLWVRRAVIPYEDRVTGSCEPSYRCWGLDQDPLQDE